MFYLYKQCNTELEVNKSGLVFEQGKSLQRSARKTGLFLYVVGFLAVSVSWQSASAGTFDNESTAELQRLCGGDFSGFGSSLNSICQAGAAAGSSTGAGAQSQPNSILISQQQLKDTQTNKEKEDMVPGGSADVLSSQWGDSFNTFLTFGTTDLRHRNNEFEDGYTATIPSVTIGGGYQISKNLEAGLAFNYSNSDGDYNSGGGFEVDSYTPLLYINYLPFDNTFANLVLGYTRQDQSNNRIAVVDILNDGTDVRPLSTK